MDIAMLANHLIVTDPSRNLVRITLTGFFEVDAVAAFETALRAAHAALPCPRNAHVTLIDCTQIQIQSQTVVAAFTAMAQDPTLRSKRAALILGPSLARTQARRIYEGDHDRLSIFADRSSAEAWLLAPPLSAARTASRYRHAPASPRSGGHGCTVPNGA
jgi:hypothetical protein